MVVPIRFNIQTTIATETNIIMMNHRWQHQHNNNNMHSTIAANVSRRQWWLPPLPQCPTTTNKRRTSRRCFRKRRCFRANVVDLIRCYATTTITCVGSVAANFVVIRARKPFEICRSFESTPRNALQQPLRICCLKCKFAFIIDKTEQIVSETNYK